MFGTPIRLRVAGVRMRRDKLALLARAVIRRVSARDEGERRAWIAWINEILGDPAPAALTWSMTWPAPTGRHSEREAGRT